MTKNKQTEFLLLKIKSPQGVDFYAEHIKVINQCGYVDFAKVGNSKINVGNLKEGYTIYIKESIGNGGKLYSAKLISVSDKGEVFPDYYNGLNIERAYWFRIAKLTPIEKLDYLDGYETRAGGDVKRALKSMSPNFYIVKRNEQ